MKIVTVIGARPQFIKAFPVSRAIERHNSEASHQEIIEVLLHTGQHYDYNMSQIFFDQLNIPRPQYHLDIQSGRHGEMTGAMLSKIESVLLQEEPDWVMVYGDTNSTLAGGLAASKLRIPVIHVEAGLRSFNRRMPEEINRVLTDHISTILFCPTDAAVTNLNNEGIVEGVLKVGDVMYDAFLFFKDLAVTNSSILFEMGLKARSYCLATVHRQENTDDIDNLQNIFAAFEQIAGSDCPLICPVHPRTRKALEEAGIARSNGHVRLIPPLGYLDMIALESNARVILTDSGGVQKEAYFCRVPCVTLREETEWIETIESGWNQLGGTECRRIREAFERALYFPCSQHSGFYGGGQASRVILNHVIHYKLGL